MGEWATYSLSDFLMFSPQAYWRLVARYNAAWWPGQLLAQAAGLALVGLLVRRKDRAALVILAAAWAWVGWAFAAQRYAEIFLAGGWLAAACAVQALVLVGAAAVPLKAERESHLGWLGWMLLAIALLYPLQGAGSARSWNEAEVFGFMPDPTALASLGALLAMGRLARWLRVLLAALPLAFLALGLATRWLIA
jgi:Family of unknown function (DUF6064)